VEYEDEQTVKATLELLLKGSDLRGRSTGALSILAKDVSNILGTIEEVCLKIILGEVFICLFILGRSA
jgi:hypothetical protein